MLCPVPPRLAATVTPFHVELVIDPAQSNVLVDQLTFDGACACVSHEPAAGELTNRVTSTNAPDCSVTSVVPALFLTTAVPEVWLLLNEKIAPTGRVVASGSWNVCPPEPVTRYVGEDAAVRVVVVPAAATEVNPSKTEFTVRLALASRRATLFAPDDAVTPVPPLATASVPANVMAPVVALDGVRPVVPAEKLVTPPVLAAQLAVVPLDVKT